MADLAPAFPDFARGFEAGGNQAIFARLSADLDTPVSLMLKLGGGSQRDAFILESVTGGEVRGRYSIIGVKPDVVWECRGETSRINRAARYDRDAFDDLEGSPLETLRALIAESRIDLPESLPAAAAGRLSEIGRAHV